MAERTTRAPAPKAAPPPKVTAPARVVSPKAAPKPAPPKVVLPKVIAPTPTPPQPAPARPVSPRPVSPRPMPAPIAQPRAPQPTAIPPLPAPRPAPPTLRLTGSAAILGGPASLTRADASRDAGVPAPRPPGNAAIPGGSALRTKPDASKNAEVLAPRVPRPAPTTGGPAKSQPAPAGGARVPVSVRAAVEASLQVDMQEVRVHTDASAQNAARQLNARAFTVGNNIYLGPGEQSTDTALMAHEMAHVVQQQGAPALQRWGGSTSDRFEHEAVRAARAVQQRSSYTVRERTGGPRIQRLGLSDILDGLAELAANVPGFTLLTLIIGRNPINLRVVERNAVNVLRAFMGLIPGGEILFQILTRYGVMQRLGDWVVAQVAELGLTYQTIRDAFVRFTDSLSWTDIFSPGDVWRRAQNIFTPIITRIRAFVSNLVSQAITWLKETFMEPLSAFCREIPGYGLVTVLLGRDPFTGAAVPRTALNVVRAFAEFIPGGTEKVNQLVESRALERAYQWFIQETQARNLTWDRISGTFAEAWASLQLSDVLDPLGTLRRLVNMFRPLMVDLVSFAGAALMKLLELIFEAVMGAGGARILAILKRARATFIIIIQNPVGFLRNLLGAVGQGVRQFMRNILAHLRDGVIAWLTGPVARAGIQMPERWDLRGIIWFVLQIMGLTWDRVRSKLVRLLGERVVATLEAGFVLLQEIRQKGIVQALRDRVTEFFGQLRDAALGGIRSFIQQRLVMAGITQLISLLNPVGAVIQAIIKTYTTIQFFIQRINQILDLVESVVNSISAIASGAIGAAANFVERTMARTIPIILDFLARFIGLGDVGGHVQRTIRSLQARVDQMLDRAVDWIRTQAQRIGTAIVQAGVPQDPNQRLRLAAQAAVTAARRLTGRVSQALLNPILQVIKLRYGLRSLEPYQQGGFWWVRATINPTVNENLGVPSLVNPADAAQTQGVLDLYRGIHYRDKPLGQAQLTPQQLQEQLIREEDFSDAVYSILGITREQAPTTTLAQRQAAAQTVATEVQNAQNTGAIRPWWRTARRPNLFFAMLQRFINRRTAFQSELRQGRVRQLSGFTFTDIPFISTTKIPQRAAQYAKGSVVATNVPATALPNTAGKVVGKVFVYLFAGNDLVQLRAADIRVLGSQQAIAPHARYSKADAEVTFTGSIPATNRIAEVPVQDVDSIAGVALRARQIANAQAASRGGLLPWS